MKIVSEFRDYYDYGLAWTSEDALTYQRTPTMEYLPKEYQEICSVLIPHGNHKDIWQESMAYFYEYNIWDTFLIGFCGTLHVGLVYANEQNLAQGLYIYDEAIEAFFERAERETKMKKTKLKQHFKYVKDRIKQAFNIPAYMLENIYQQYHTPIFAIYRGSLYINPCLYTFHFQDVVACSQAFQAIEQFLFGVLIAPENPMITVSNEDKILKNGFDLEWSFRKKPEKKKN